MVVVVVVVVVVTILNFINKFVLLEWVNHTHHILEYFVSIQEKSSYSKQKCKNKN